MVVVRNFLIIGLVIIVFTTCLFGAKFWWFSRSHSTSQTVRIEHLSDNDVIQLAFSRGNEHYSSINTLKVLVVVSLEAMEQGLSGRSTVPFQGMLFILPKRDIPRFWMKEMLFDLDIVWIDRDTIVDISHNVPAPDSQTALKDLPIFSPTHPATLVLEIPAGQSQSLGLQVGNKIHLIAN